MYKVKLDPNSKLWHWIVAEWHSLLVTPAGFTSDSALDAISVSHPEIVKISIRHNYIEFKNKDAFLLFILKNLN